MCKSDVSVKNMKNETLSLLAKATGPISIRLTNDYLFRALLQKNNSVLKALIASLLHLSPDKIKTVTIINSVELGKTIDEKTYILDIHVLMNDTTSINLEMQVVNEHNWPERSLIYLARSFDSLNKGEAYAQIRPAVQISILDYTLFPEHPEFYATYYMLNVKNHEKYSDRFRLSVLDLTHIELATDEDKTYGIDRWAAFFKATTWEELKELVKNDQILGEAAVTVYEVSQDENIRLQCEAREDYYRRQRAVECMLQELSGKNAKLASELSEAASKNTQLFNELNEAASKNTQLFNELNEAASKNTQLSNELNEATSKNTQLFNELNEVTSKNAQLSNELNETASKNEQLSNELNETASKNEQLSNELNEAVSKNSQLSDDKAKLLDILAANGIFVPDDLK